MTLVGSGLVGQGGDGAGFQLFTQSNNDSGIYANAAARDVYFAANPADLARLEEDEFLIIKLLDDGAGDVAYQQRSNGNWLDVTSLIQGEQGVPGASGNSFFFTSEADRDAFFTTSPSLLETDLPVMVNESGTVTVFTWTGVNNPAIYDAELFRPASLGAAAGSLTLGLDGYKISSGGRVLDHKDAYGVDAITVLSRYDSSGSAVPSTHELAPIGNTDYAVLFPDTLSDPQTIQFIPEEDVLLVEFIVRPAAAGELRFQAFAGTLETGPILIDKTITISLGQVNTLVPLPTGNQLLAFKGDFILLKFSGVQLRGGLQAVGPFTGQTVPLLASSNHRASLIEIATFGRGGALALPDGSTQQTSASFPDEKMFASSFKRGATTALPGVFTPVGVDLPTSGAKMFVQAASGNATAFNLSKPWDSSSLAAAGSFPVPGITTAAAVAVLEDLSKYFTVDLSDDTLKEFLMTDGDITTLVATDSELFLGGEDIGPRHIKFSANYDKVFMFGANSKYFQYDLPISGTLKGGTYSGKFLDFSSFTVNAVQGEISGDGRHVYVGDLITDEIFYWKMTTPWEIETAVPIDKSDFLGPSNFRNLVVNPSGTRAITVDASTSTVTNIEFGIKSEGKLQGDNNPVEFIKFQDGSVQSHATSPDGFKFFAETITPRTSQGLAVLNNTPTDIVWTFDGATAFVPQEGFGIFQYDASIPWDETSLVLVDSIGVTQETSIRGISINNDASRLWLLGNNSDAIHEFDMPGDITTLVYTGNSVDLSNEDPAPRILRFSPDLKFFFMMGSNARIFKYELPINGTIKGAFYTGDNITVSGQDPIPFGLDFTPDGLRIFMLGLNDIVFQYNLKTPYDITTALFTEQSDVVGGSLRGIFLKPDGQTFFAVDQTIDSIVSFNFGIKVPGKIIGEVEINPVDVIEFEDGSTQYIAALPDLTRGRLPTAKSKNIFNVSVLDTNPTGLFLTRDGTKIFLIGNQTKRIIAWDLSTAWDTDTATLAGVVDTAPMANPSGLDFKPDGLRMFILGSGIDSIGQFTLTVPFDITTAVFDVVLPLGGTDNTPFSMVFHPSGKSFYFLGLQNDTVYRYDMSTPWDVLTGVVSTDEFEHGQGFTVVAVDIRSDGEMMYLSDEDGTVYDYLLTEPWTVNSAELLSTTDLSNQGLAVTRGIHLSPSGHKLYFASTADDSIHEFDLGVLTDGFVIDGNPSSSSETDFKSIADRDAFFTSNPSLLETDFFVVVNNNEVIETFIWTGPDSPVSYDASLFRSASLGVSAGSLTFGDQGYTISSGDRVLDHKDPYGDNAFTVVSRHDATGSEPPHTFELSPAEVIDYAPIFTSIFGDPQQFIFITNTTKLIETFSFRPFTAGELRFQVFAGTTDTDPILIDKTITISAGQINTYVELVTDNQLLMFKDDEVLLKISGVTLTGGVQTSGLYDTQNIPTFRTNEHAALELEVTVFGADRDLRFQDLSTQSTAAIQNGFAFQASTLTAGKIETLDITTNEPSGMWWSNGGTVLLFSTLSAGLHSYSVSIPYDISTAVFTASVSFGAGSVHIGLWVSQDGTKLFVGADTGALIHEFGMSTPFDITTLFDTGNTLDFGPETTDLRDIAVRPDGKKLFVFSGTPAFVFEYDLPIALTLKNTSYSGNSALITASAVGGTFSPDGNAMYTMGFTAETVDQFNLTTPWDITTSQLTESSDAFGAQNARSIVWHPSGNRAWFVERNTMIVHELLGGLKVPGKILGPENTVYSFNGPSTFEIHSAADWEALAVAGVITISSQTTIKILARFETASVINVIGDDLTITGDNDENSTITYTGSGTFVTVTGDFVFRTNAALFLTATGGGTLISFTGASTLTGGVSIIDSNLRGWADLGTITRGFLNLINTPLVAYSAPFKLVDSFITGTISSVFGGVAVEFNWNDPTYSLDTSVNVSGFSSFSALTRVSAFIPENVRVLIPIGTTGSPNVAVFDTTGGSTGTYSGVSQREMPLGIITSIADDGSGNASFTIPTPPVVGQVITISGFIINTAYNGTFRTTSAGGGLFEVEDLSTGVQVPFGTNEAGVGVASGPGIAVASTAHGLSNGDKLQLSSDLSTRYDGGYEIYNVLTNTFDVGATFVDTQTGTWDTSPIDQTNPNVLAFQVVDNPTSHYIACAHVNNNTTANGAIVNNTFTAMVFGTIGAALLQSSTTERWKLVDEIAGVFEYTGNEPFDNSIQFDFTVTSSGGTVDFRFKWEIDTGSGFVNLPDDVEALLSVGSDAQGVTKKFPLKAVKGDQIRPRITRNSGGSGITTSYATIFAGD